MLNSMLQKLAPVAVACVALTTFVVGQQQTPPPTPPPTPPATAPAQEQKPVFKTGVELVRLDVSVLDSLRLPAKGLKMSDFTVLEESKPQKLTRFTDTRGGARGVA